MFLCEALSLSCVSDAFEEAFLLPSKNMSNTGEAVKPLTAFPTFKNTMFFCCFAGADHLFVRKS